MQNKLFTTLLEAGIAIIIGGAITLTPAISQTIKATLVQNVDEPARSPYQEQQVGSGSLAFGIVPADKRLVITHASGSTSLAAEADPLTVIVEPVSSGVGTHPVGRPILQFVPSIAQQDGKSYVANGDLQMYFEAGQHPIAAFSSSYSASITLSGYYVDIP